MYIYISVCLCKIYRDVCTCLNIYLFASSYVFSNSCRSVNNRYIMVEDLANLRSYNCISCNCQCNVLREQKFNFSVFRFHQTATVYLYTQPFCIRNKLHKFFFGISVVWHISKKRVKICCIAGVKLSLCMDYCLYQKMLKIRIRHSVW
jgi:hypothetical protein